MADYYPLLSRALDALPDRSPALRKAVYERARSALIGQLRTLDPPLPEADIDLERQALDAAIARLEADYGAPSPPPPPAAEPAPPPAPNAAAAKPAPAPKPAPVPKPVPPAKPEPSPPSEAKPAPPPPPAPAPPPPKAMPEPAPVQADAPPSPVLPEPGPPPDFVPFVPPPRRPKPDEAPQPEGAAPQPAESASLPGAVPADGANGRRRPRLDVRPPRAGRSRQLRNLVIGGVLAAVIASIAVAAILLADKRSDLPQNGAEAPGAARPAPDAKLSDRVGGERPETDGRPGSAESGSDLTVAQRAVLYEENASDPRAAPVATQGRVVWRLDAVSGEQGQPLQSAVRADIAFPDAGLTLAMTIRKNIDPTLPASHTVELAFTNYGPGEKRAVQEIGLIQLKDEESARGSPVSGLPVRVRDNLFLIGLSNLPNEVDRNTELLKHRNWFDLAVKYKSGARAILTFEKGSAGARAMQSAFDQWRE